MGIFRGVGGTGESSSDSTINATTALVVQAEAAATAAAASETAAETAETNAASSASAASSSASSAASAKTAAEAARDAALVAYDSFDDRYLGGKTSDPSVDNDGNALIAGSLYYNTTSSVMKVYTGSIWVAAYVDSADFLAKASNLSDLPSASTARTNLGLGTAATTNSTAYATAAQGTKADSALQAADIGTIVQAYDADLTTLGAGGSAARSFLGLAIGTDVQAYDADLTTLGAGGASARTFLGLAIGTDVQAYDANTAKTNVVQSFSVAQRGTATALTSSSASIATNLALANNFTHTLTENTTLANPTNITAGQSGVIVFTQHASAPKTMAFGSYWKFPAGTAPSLTATNSAVDVLAYYVESSTRITARMLSDVK